MQLIHKGQSLGQPVPTIGANGNWFIEGQDTGIKADATKIDRGTLTGDISVLDTATEPGVYNWIDRFGELGEFNGGLWNIKVEVSFYTTAPSIVQIATSTYHAFFAGVVKVRAKYYANNNNGSKWSPWVTLANTTQTSSPNLIKNWYFQKGVTLNQRGQDEYSWNGTGDVHFIDGWRFTTVAFLSGGRFGASLNDTGLVVDTNGSSDTSFDYPFEDPIFKALRGKQVTFSILLSSGEFGSKTLTVATKGDEEAMRKNRISVGNMLGSLYSWTGYDNSRLCLAISSAATSQSSAATSQSSADTIRAVKLEMGNHQTLCRQDINGNWVLNDPPPDPGELSRWGGRYFQRIGRKPRIRMACRTANTVWFDIPTVPMRATPSIKTRVNDENVYWIRDISNASLAQITDFEIGCEYNAEEENLLLALKKTNHGINDCSLLIDGYIDLDASL